MKPSEHITVLLVDDHPVVRNGYHRLLENHPDIKVVAEASSGEEALKKFTNFNPDVVVLDLNMPGIGGLEVIRHIRANDPDAHILVFSMHNSKTMVMRALEAGAAGYLTKSSAAAQMVDAIRQVRQGKVFMGDELMPELIKKESRGHDPLQLLTEREFQVFQFLAEGRSVQEIAETLSISPKTTGVHQTNIMKKLNLHNAAELARLAIRCGVSQP